MKTMMAKESQVEKKWYIVDAEDKILGRFSTEVAKILKGKHKPIYTPHVDTGDYVIIINAEKIKVTGKKSSQKLYRHHTGFIGGLKEVSYKSMMEKHPERILKHAIKGMLPKNSLGRQMLKKLKVYVGPEHKNEAQMPEVLEIKA